MNIFPPTILAHGTFLMIGGFDYDGDKVTTVYEFTEDGANNYVWELKPYSLGIGRSSAVPLYVPDEFVNCPNDNMYE